MGNSTDDRISFVIVYDSTNDLYQLFVDSNNNEDLTDDGGAHSNQGTGRLGVRVSLSGVEVVTDSGSTITRPNYLWMWLDTSDRVRFYTRCHYRGEITFGDVAFTVIAFEYGQHDALTHCIGKEDCTLIWTAMESWTRIQRVLWIERWLLSEELRLNYP